MPSLKAIRKRIGSIKSSQKITRAMKMVAGARLTRAQQRITALRPYAQKTGEILAEIQASAVRDREDKEASAEAAQVQLHPLLDFRPEQKVLYVVLSSDRGLCGAFNANVIKASLREWQRKQGEGKEVRFATIGKKGRDGLLRRKAQVDKDFLHMFDGLELSKVKLISEWLVPRFLKGEYDAIYLVYNEFKSAITQKLVVEPLLPLPPPSADAAAAKTGESATHEFVFEPTRDTLLESLVPMYVDIALFRALLESQASEFGARMSAMDSATRNAKDMIGRLTLVYNRARQAAITKELMEIIGGAEALKD
jgi:F-type H+-transporting ATPase subunit gamma